MLLRARSFSTLFGERRAAEARRSPPFSIAIGPRGLWRHVLAIGVLAPSLAVCLAWSPVRAQNSETEQADGPTVSSAINGSVLVINMERVLREADAARSIQRQAEEIRESIQRQLSGRQDALRAEEQELVSLRQTLPPEEFTGRVDDFEQRVRKLKRASNERSSLLQKALFEANEELKKNLRPELIAIMQERSAAVMIDERNVVISARILDVTGEAIERLNASTPKIVIVWNDDGWTSESASGQTDAGDGSTERSQSGDTSGDKPSSEDKAQE